MKRKTKKVLLILITSLFLIIIGIVLLKNTEIYPKFIMGLGHYYHEHGRLEKAEGMFKKVVEINPENNQAYTWLGRLYREQYRFGDAEEILKKVIEINPNNYDAYQLLSRTYIEQDKSEDVEKIFVKIEDMLKDMVGTNPYATYLNLGHFYQLRKEPEKTEEMYKKAIGVNSSKYEAYIELGHIYRVQDKLEEAEEVLKKAIEINPKSGKAKDILGQVYMQMGDYEKSEGMLNESIKNKNHPGCPYQALGVLYTTLNKTDKAIENYMIMADREPFAHYQQFQVAEICFNFGDYYCALKYVNRAIKLNNQAIYRQIKGFTLLMLREYEEAEKIFKELDDSGFELYAYSGFGHIAIINKDYQTAEKHFLTIISNLDRNEPILYGMTHLGLGWVYANQNKHVDALKNYELILKYNPKHLLGLVSKGNSLIWLDRLDDALEIFNRASVIYPDNEYIIAERGLVEYHKGDYASAEASFKKALVRNDETYSCPYEGLGLVYFKQGKFNEAKHNLEKSINVNPDIEYKKYNTLAKIYIQEGRLDEARELLEKSIENYPYDNEAQQLLDEL